MIYLLKIIALGSSRAIVLPAPLLSALDVDRGDILVIRPDKPNGFRLGRAPTDVLRPTATEQNVIVFAARNTE